MPADAKIFKFSHLLGLILLAIIRSLTPLHKVIHLGTCRNCESSCCVHTGLYSGKVLLRKMDDPDVDHELIALLRQSLGISDKAQDTVSSDTGKGYVFYCSCVAMLMPLFGLLSLISSWPGYPLSCRIAAPSLIANVANDHLAVLKDAEHIAYHAIDVSIDMYGTRDAASQLYKAMCERNYSTQTWSEHELHPKLGVDLDEVGLLNFIFTMDLLNFSFWSEKSSEERYQVEYRGKRWTGYNSLVACLRRALDEGIPITTPRFWRTTQDLSATMEHVFRSATNERVPLFEQRVKVLREAADVLCEVS